MDRKTKNLLKKLNNKDPKVRYDAVLALGKLGDISLIDELEKVATLDDNPKVRDLAGKAVKTLNVLNQREREKQKALLKAQLAQEQFDWPELAQERMLQNRDFRDVEDEAWDYQKKIEKLRAEKESVALATKRATRRKRWRFRIFLLFALVIVGIGGFVAVREYLDESPKNEEEALTKSRDIVIQQQAALVKYCEVLGFDTATNCQQPSGVATLECSTLKSVEVPVIPAWFSKDEATLVGKEAIVDAVVVVNEDLEFIQENINTTCTDKEMVNVAEWPEYVALGNLTFKGLGEAAAISSFIETELNTPDPTPTPES